MANPFVASDSMEFFETDDISPLSTQSPNDPFSTRKYDSITEVHQGSFSNIMGIISPSEPNIPPWVDSCWSDAATAGAVLSLLHKDPLRPPLNRTRELQSTQDRQRQTCAACLESLEPEQFPESSIAAGCDHTSITGKHICKICLSRSLDIQFSSYRTPALACPLCSEPLSDNEVERWASQPTFQAYDNARTWQMLEEDAEFVTCIRGDCGYGQLHAGGLEDPIVVCGSCGTRTCFIHRDSPWHEGLTCAQYEAMRDTTDSLGVTHELRRMGLPDVLRIGVHSHGQSNSDEFLTQRTIQETTRPCPGCHVATEKAGGCKYMRCGMCWREWCWDCGVFWEQGHLRVDCSVFSYDWQE